MLDYNKEIFVNRLKMLRKEKGLTQPELGEVIEKSKGAIGHYESGSREPNMDTMYAFAKYFGVSVDYMIGVSDFRNEEEAVDYMFMKFREAGLIKNDKLDKKTIDKMMNYISTIEKIKSS